MSKYNYEVDMDSNTSAAKIIREIRKGSTVLEVGCATGYMTKVLSEQWQCEIYAIEINEDAARSARDKTKQLIVGDIEQLELKELFKNIKFDYILFADVLEHLREPLIVLKKCSELLKPDGSILASLPNISHSAVALNLLKGNFEYTKIGLLDETHIKFFTRKNVKMLFESAGYYIEMFDTTTIKPEFTEISIAKSEFPQEIINYIYMNNPDADTYQFIVQAKKANNETALYNLQMDIKKLETQIAQINKEKNELAGSLELQIKYTKDLEKAIAAGNSAFKELENVKIRIEKENSDFSQLNKNLQEQLDSTNTALSKKEMEVQGIYEQLERVKDDILLAERVKHSKLLRNIIMKRVRK